MVFRRWLAAILLILTVAGTGICLIGCQTPPVKHVAKEIPDIQQDTLGMDIPGQGKPRVLINFIPAPGQKLLPSVSDAVLQAAKPIPVPGEPLPAHVPNNLVTIFNNKAFYIDIEPLNMRNFTRQTECRLLVTNYSSPGYSPVLVKVKAMDVWFTDANNKRVGTPRLTTIITPWKTYTNTPFEDIPELQKTGTPESHSYILQRQFNERTADFPAEITMHCHAELEIQGEAITVDKALKLVKDSLERG